MQALLGFACSICDLFGFVPMVPRHGKQEEDQAANARNNKAGAGMPALLPSGRGCSHSSPSVPDKVRRLMGLGDPVRSFTTETWLGVCLATGRCNHNTLPLPVSGCEVAGIFGCFCNSSPLI